MEQLRELEKRIPIEIEGMPYFCQDDPRWAHESYTVVDDPEQTIATSGCIPSCQAMIVSKLTDISVNPVFMAGLNVACGYRMAESTAHTALIEGLEIFGLKTIEITDHHRIIAALEGGGVVSISGHLLPDSEPGLPGTESGHFYVVRGYEVDSHGVLNLLVNDPKSPGKSVTPHAFVDIEPTIFKAYATFALIEK